MLLLLQCCLLEALARWGPRRGHLHRLRGGSVSVACQEVFKALTDKMDAVDESGSETWHFIQIYGS